MFPKKKQQFLVIPQIIFCPLYTGGNHWVFCQPVDMSFVMIWKLWNRCEKPTEKYFVRIWKLDLWLSKSERKRKYFKILWKRNLWYALGTLWPKVSTLWWYENLICGWQSCQHGFLDLSTLTHRILREQLSQWKFHHSISPTDFSYLLEHILSMFCNFMLCFV